MLKEEKSRASEALELLRIAAGNSSGSGISCVDWDGTVYPDQFMRNHPLGNVQQRKFGEIWMDESNDLLKMLREKSRHVKGRCAKCRFMDVCGGGFRARAEAMTGDLWASDPACYLTDEEIG